MESLRNASRNTMFERWLESAMAQPGSAPKAPAAAAGLAPAHSGSESEEGHRLQDDGQELAPFLPTRETSGSKDATTFRPGWEVSVGLAAASIPQLVEAMSEPCCRGVLAACRCVLHDRS